MQTLIFLCINQLHYFIKCIKLVLFVALLSLLLMMILSTFIIDAMVAVTFVITMIGISSNIYRDRRNKDVPVESFNNTIFNIVFSFAGL